MAPAPVVLNREVDLAVETVEEGAGDHRADRVDLQVGVDDVRVVVAGLAKLIDGRGRDHVMTVGQGHLRNDIPRSTAVGLHRANWDRDAGRQVGRGQGDLGKAFGVIEPPGRVAKTVPKKSG